ncbi:DNA repair protein RadA [Shewanella aestuarii]|uniref:DNA repair protein RadA n=1 Tax=Shewanella aestuarii TaxID=1028752 RepID=A0A6G9QRH9_9GAMM|nr:DNA repair protein RadA [Shewanella aestuarii]QIR16655.1 DNA repair protein RadA [Shewanella aestuarii]
MAKKSDSVWGCSECGATTSKWVGQCVECKNWNTVVELKIAKVLPTSNIGKNAGFSGYAGSDNVKPLKMSEINQLQFSRASTGSSEFDRVLGGGVTLGSVVLLSGDPGSGKTSLLTSVAHELALAGKVLYVTGEESSSQFKQRSEERFGHDWGGEREDSFRLSTSTEVELLLAEIEQLSSNFVFIDSIQTLFSQSISGQPGGIAQVSYCAKTINAFAKKRGITIFMIAHVNKSSELAGPKLIEHVADTILHIEVADSGNVRTARASKNRFGDTDEIGLFVMQERGMTSISNPSKFFLVSDVQSPGSAITMVQNGNRNLALEIQCLTSEAEGEFATRNALGISMSRLKMIIAVCRKHTGARINHDVYINLVGGLKIPETDTSTDLATAAALLSSLNDIIIPTTSCFIGEVSLNGSVRPVSNGVPRVREALKIGFKNIYISKANYHANMLKDMPDGASITQIATISDLKDALI